MAGLLATEHNEIYGSLPGIEVPVGDALVSLSNMWNAPPSSEQSRSPSEFRASRMNFILHFGFEASVEDAQELFQSVIGFSKKYPCRILALCPSKDEDATGQGIVCKIFSECYIGDGHGDMSCCEALIFGYTLKEKRYLEDQISIFLESDVPTYYGPYRFDSPKNLSDYQSFLGNVDRVVIDTAVELYSVEELEVPKPEIIHDLAFARTLSLRQSIGQFFSAFPVDRSLEGLTAIEVDTPDSLNAELRGLMLWIQSVLEDCQNCVENSKRDRFDIVFGKSEEAEIRFVYVNENAARCQLNLEAGVAHFDAAIGGNRHSMSAVIHLLDSDDALAEALFFG